MELIKYIAILSYFLLSNSSEIHGDILPVGSNDCFDGYSWCASTNDCIRHWESPCPDNYIDCSDCLKRQMHGENIACPINCDISNCVSDKDCDENNFCRLSTLNEYGPKECVKFSTVGQSCGGYTLPSNINICDPLLECVNTMGPYIADAPGQCMYPCNSGSVRDDYGNCIPPVEPPPAPHPICSNVMCDMYCENGFQKGDNGCDICSCDDGCSIPYSECDNLYACPKVTEVTQCNVGGVEGYTTYQLSIILKDNQRLKNMYAIYGSTEEYNTPMYIPPAWHVPGAFGNNVGGISSDIISINPSSLYDSWLTIGITDGNINNDINTIGIQFNNWNENNGIVVNNGAVFLMNPDIEIDTSRDIIVGQLTVATGTTLQAVLNIQGKFFDNNNNNNNNNNDNSWKQELMVFNLNQPSVLPNDHIPNGCVSWYDGCNNCIVDDGNIRACTRMMCFTEDTPRCLSFDQSGH